MISLFLDCFGGKGALGAHPIGVGLSIGFALVARHVPKFAAIPTGAHLSRPRREPSAELATHEPKVHNRSECEQEVERIRFARFLRGNANQQTAANVLEHWTTCQVEHVVPRILTDRF